MFKCSHRSWFTVAASIAVMQLMSANVANAGEETRLEQVRLVCFLEELSADQSARYESIVHSVQRFGGRVQVIGIGIDGSIVPTSASKESNPNSVNVLRGQPAMLRTGSEERLILFGEGGALLARWPADIAGSDLRQALIAALNPAAAATEVDFGTWGKVKELFR